MPTVQGRLGAVRRDAKFTTLLCMLLLSLSGCHGVGRLDRFGGRPLEGEDIWRSAAKAFWHPQTIVPLTGALVFGLEDFDEKGSQWAIKHRPVFKTSERANRASDDYIYLLLGEAAATALAMPVGSADVSWARAKAGQLAAESFTVGVTYASVQGLKQGIGRTGPDGWKDTSMPSGHASAAFLFSTLSNQHIDTLCPDRPLRVTLQLSNIALAAGAGWSRVEGGHHYPSDVLAGAAFGHFMSAFMYDLLVGRLADSGPALAVHPTLDGGAVTIGIRF